MSRTGARVAIIGTTAWGTTLGVMLGQRDIRVKLWARSEEEARALNRARENPTRLPGISWPQVLEASGSMEEALAGADLLIFAVPSQTMRANAGQARDYLDEKTLVLSASKGLEVELAGKLPRGIVGRTSWSYNDVEVPESELTPGRGEPRGPRHMIKANFMLPLAGKDSRLGIELRHVSKRLTVRREWTDPFTLVNVTLADRKLLGGTEIRASVYNLFDADNGHPGTWGEEQQVIWQDGRSYRLYLTVSR